MEPQDSRERSSIRIGISSCLLGEKVRFDGGHKHDRYLTETLAHARLLYEGTRPAESRLTLDLFELQSPAKTLCSQLPSKKAHLYGAE